MNIVRLIGALCLIIGMGIILSPVFVVINDIFGG